MSTTDLARTRELTLRAAYRTRVQRFVAAYYAKHPHARSVKVPSFHEWLAKQAA